MPQRASASTDPAHPLVHYDYGCDERTRKQGKGEHSHLLARTALLYRLIFQSFSCTHLRSPVTTTRWHSEQVNELSTFGGKVVV